MKTEVEGEKREVRWRWMKEIGKEFDRGIGENNFKKNLKDDLTDILKNALKQELEETT